MSRDWSDQQKNIFNWFKNGSGNLVVRARAGTGKTTTILEAINYAPEENILLVAFNKNIATELQQKLNNPKAEAKTLHSLGFSFIRRNWSNVKVDNDRDIRLARSACGGDSAPDTIVSLVKKLASLGKSICPFPNHEQMLDIAYEFDLLPPDSEWEEVGWTDNRIVECAIGAMNLALKKDGSISFDDMIYIPVVHKWVRPQYDLVVVDECQDMNQCQLLLAIGSCKKNGRIAVVGDDRQAIYRFRGADSGSLNRLKEELKAIEMGLTITYRCPRKVVEMAARLVPDYQCGPNNSEGVISYLDYQKLAESVSIGDFILSRKNAPLATAALALLRVGKPAKVSGKDIAATLLNLVNKWKGDSIPRFIEKITKWQERELTRASKLPEEKREKKEQSINDQAETILALSDGCAGVNELRSRIQNMFVDETKDPGKVILCSSIHKAKGQERDRVYLFVDTLYPGKKSKNNIEEMNLEYVGITRSKKELHLVTGIK